PCWRWRCSPACWSGCCPRCVPPGRSRRCRSRRSRRHGMFPLLSALRRNPMMPRLIVLQVAVACAILCNTLFLLGQQAGPLLVDDGLAGDELVIVDQVVSRGAPWTPAQTRAGREALAAIPGVRAASAASGVPMRQTLTLTFDLKSANGTTLT